MAVTSIEIAEDWQALYCLLSDRQSEPCSFSPRPVFYGNFRRVPIPGDPHLDRYQVVVIGVDRGYSHLSRGFRRCQPLNEVTYRALCYGVHGLLSVLRVVRPEDYVLQVRQWTIDR